MQYSYTIGMSLSLFLSFERFYNPIQLEILYFFLDFLFHAFFIKIIFPWHLIYKKLKRSLKND